MVSPTSASASAQFLPTSIREPGAELELAPADDFGGVKQQRNALFDWGAGPDSYAERAACHGLLGVLRSGFLVDAYDLPGSGRVDGADLAVGAEAFTADYQVVFAAELTSNMVKGGLHGAVVFRRLEIDKRLIAESALGRARLDRSR